MLKQIFAVILNIVGFIFIALSLLFILFESSIDHTMDKNRVIDTAFKQTNEFVQSYINESNKLPANSDLEQWASQFQGNNRSPKRIRIITDNFPSEITRKYRNPEGEFPYALSYWRGEWNEYYISWENESTVIKKRSEYYWSGNSLLEWLLPVLTGCLILFIVNKSKINNYIKKLEKSN